MPIPKNKYIELKPYFDFQRKKEYNKEQLKAAVEHITLHPDALFNELWTKMSEEDMREPHPDWVPENEKLKIEGEE